jgi:hypothetical protein
MMQKKNQRPQQPDYFLVLTSVNAPEKNDINGL